MASTRTGCGRRGATTRAGSGVAVFAADHSIRSLVDPVGSVTHWTEHDRGGHFPAMEVPDLFVDNVRAFFSGLQK